MKKTPLSIAVCVALMTMNLPSQAADAPKPQASSDKMDMMMGGMSAEQQDQHFRAMQEHLLKMHELSSQILAEKDATKKEALKKEQLELIKADHARRMAYHHKMKSHP